MTARQGELRFCVDESALGLGKALAAARHDTIHIGHALIPECPVGTLDPDWIPRVAARDLTVIGRDKHIRTRPEERRLLRDAGLRVFRIGGKRDLVTWDWLARLVRFWPQMERILEARPDGPWFYLINENGLAEVPLVDAPQAELKPRTVTRPPPRVTPPGDPAQASLFES
jgi:hypothetical protein